MRVAALLIATLLSSSPAHATAFQDFIYPELTCIDIVSGQRTSITSNLTSEQIDEILGLDYSARKLRNAMAYVSTQTYPSHLHMAADLKVLLKAISEKSVWNFAMNIYPDYVMFSGQTYALTVTREMKLFKGKVDPKMLDELGRWVGEPANLPPAEPYIPLNEQIIEAVVVDDAAKVIPNILEFMMKQPYFSNVTRFADLDRLMRRFQGKHPLWRYQKFEGANNSGSVGYVNGKGEFIAMFKQGAMIKGKMDLQRDLNDMGEWRGTWISKEDVD